MKRYGSSALKMFDDEGGKLTATPLERISDTSLGSDGLGPCTW